MPIPNLIERILASAAREMWKEERTLGRYTADTAQHELNLAFHYASRLRRWLHWLDCDFDVQKRPFDNRRPDIIFHRRGNHDDNFLIVEVKRAGDLRGGRADLSKIRDYWFKQPLFYRFGASVVFNEEEAGAQVCVLDGNESLKSAIHLPISKFSPIPMLRTEAQLREMLNA